MTVYRSRSMASHVKTLWRRSAAWRFCLLMALLLTMLAVLFPPRMRAPPALPLPAPIANSSYQIPAVPTAPATAPAGAKTTASAAAPALPVQRTSPGSAYPASARSAPPTAAPSPQTSPGNQAQVATLSLATPGGQSMVDQRSGLDRALLGRTYQDYILASGFKVPLPPGQWAMLANTSIAARAHPENKGIAYFLGDIENKRLVGAVWFYAMRSTPPPGVGFEEFKGCAMPDNLYSSHGPVSAFGHQSCWTMHAFFTPPMQQWGDKAVKMDETVRAAAGDMAAKGVSYPQDFVIVQFFQSETWGLLNVSYLFSPDKDGVSSDVAPTLQDSDWFGTHVQKSALQVAYVEKLRKWGEAFLPKIMAAFETGQ
jgi:hypothetical protein